MMQIAACQGSLKRLDFEWPMVIHRFKSGVFFSRISNPAVRQTSMDQPAKAIGIINVPLDLGASRRGTDAGPSAIRVAGLSDAMRNIGFRISTE